MRAAAVEVIGEAGVERLEVFVVMMFLSDRLVPKAARPHLE